LRGFQYVFSSFLRTVPAHEKDLAEESPDKILFYAICMSNRPQYQVLTATHVCC
jgi:hypothetical protein